MPIYGRGRDSLGSAIFGPDYGPIPAIDTPADVEPDTFEQGSPYDEQVQQYLETLRTPVSLPTPPPVPKGLALAMVLNPQMADKMFALHREPYQRQLQEQELNRTREGQAATLAGGLAQRDQQRRERAWEKMHLWEQSAANAGAVNYPFQIPGMRDQARSVDTARRALTGQRNRASAGGVGIKPKFPTKGHHLVWLESRMTMRQNQLSKMYEAATMPGWDRNTNAQNVRSDAEEDYGWLRRQREAIAKMSDDQWRRFNDLTEQEQDAVIESMEMPVVDPLASP